MASIYFAAPLFTAAERSWNTTIMQTLRQRLPRHQWLVPQEFCAVHDHAEQGPDHGAIFTSCRDHLHECDLVVGVLDGPDPDSGTCWELGYAYALGKPCYGLRTDWRPGEDGTANCMLTRSCRLVTKDVEELITALESASA